jgi:hypothetical protein
MSIVVAKPALPIHTARLAGRPPGIAFAAEALWLQRGRVRFPWLGLAAMSGSLVGSAAGIFAALRLAGFGG